MHYPPTPPDSEVIIEFYPEKCKACGVCERACRDVHHFPAGSANCAVYAILKDGSIVKTHPKKKIPKEQIERLVHLTCFQCLEPYCMKACPTGAIRRDGGMVIVEERLCIGCKACLTACPWGIPWLNPKTNKISKCDLCRTLSLGIPACVSMCPTRALHVRWKVKRPYEDFIEILKEQLIYQVAGSASK